MSNPQELEILESLAEALEHLDIAYAISGSVASSVYGKVRFTQDADITVEPFDIQAEKLDLEYLRKWSSILGINELLEKAVSESK